MGVSACRRVGVGRRGDASVLGTPTPAPTRARARARARARTEAAPKPARDLTSTRFGLLQAPTADWSQAFLARINALVLTGRSRIQ